MIKISNLKLIEEFHWNELVVETYGRPYCFQQQSGCRDKGLWKLDIPSEYTEEDDYEENIPEIINGDIMGVKFDTWLKRDPKQKIPNQESDLELELFWERSFYPDIFTIANDLHKKGLIETGEYAINVDY